jgi:hypothetical protein
LLNKCSNNIHPTGVTTLKSSVFKLITISSIAMLASVSHAAWDVNFAQNNSQFLAASSSFAADGDLRFAAQMISTNEPDANGFVYVENLAHGMTRVSVSTKPWANGSMSRLELLSNSCSTSFAINPSQTRPTSLTSNTPKQKTSPACAVEVFFRLWFC